MLFIVTIKMFIRVFFSCTLRIYIRLNDNNNENLLEKKNIVVVSKFNDIIERPSLKFFIVNLSIQI